LAGFLVACGARHAIPGGADPGGTPSLADRPGRTLFNGRDLSGFYTWLVDTRDADPRQVFTVTNGLLRISGDGLGYLATRESFRDYELTVEFKWGETNTRWGDRIGKARDSGIFLHANGPDGNSHDGGGAFMAAIECNVFQGATGDFLLIRGDDAQGKLIAPRVTVTSDGRRDADGWPWWSPDGSPLTLERWGRVNWRDKDANWRDITGFRGARDVERPPGEWNQLVITCRDATIRIELNGQLVNEATDVRPREGKILLQCEGSEIFFRRVELRSLQ
jgi:hypothetical protein